MKYSAPIGYIILFFLMPFGLIGQKPDYPYDEFNYDFLNLDQNRIFIPGDSAPFNAFFAKLDNVILTGKGNINIVQIGGSHVQADIYPGRIRERLQNIAPGMKGERGFVFPYRIAKTNSPSNYWVEYTGTWESCRNVERNKFCELGVAGISVKTRDSISSFMIHKRQNISYPDYDFKKITILHDPDSSFKVFPDYGDINFRIAADSEKGLTIIYLDRYVDTLKLKILKTDSLQKQFTLYGIILENDDPGIVYSSIGVNGASVPSFIRCSLFQEQLKLLKPDLVILSLGINDASGTGFDPKAFELNYDTLIKRINKVAPDAAILLTTNNDSYLTRKKWNKNGEIVRNSMFSIAQKHQGGVWDFFTVMGGNHSILKWYKLNLAQRDKVHFTHSGYMLIGDLFYNAFLRAYDDYLEKNTINKYLISE